MAWYSGLFDGVLRFTKKDAEQTNYKFNLFDELSKQEVEIDNWSAVNQYFQSLQKDDDFLHLGGQSDKGVKNSLYGTISTNKLVRLASYRRMANFPEVGDSIDEICDSSITSDATNELITLKVPESLNDINKKEIYSAWDEFINLFDIENRMFEYMRKFVIEGELCWENIVSKDKPELGILDIKFLPAESYEYTYNMRTKKQVGLTVYIDDEGEELNGHGYKLKNYSNKGYNVGGINITQLSCYDAMMEQKALFLPWEQVTYINSGIFNSNCTFVLPVLERARRAYNQLSMIEDSIIIYRLVRAPERLVFNVDVGNANRKRAEQEVLTMMKKYNNKKVYNPTTGTISNDYDPHSILESFWFVKSQGGSGTEVTSLGGGENLGELEDLKYFLRKLYISLKIPYNRFEDGRTDSIERTTSINYEEYRFSKFIMRLQGRIALGLKDGFKTHLQLKGLWESLNLKDLDIKIRFTPPSNFERYEVQEKMSTMIEQYTAMADRDEFSNTLCMEKFLGWTKEDIEQNWKRLEDDAIRQAKIEYYVSNVEDSGHPEPMEDDDDDDKW